MIPSWRGVLQLSRSGSSAAGGCHLPARPTSHPTGRPTALWCWARPCCCTEAWWTWRAPRRSSGGWTLVSVHHAVSTHTVAKTQSKVWGCFLWLPVEKMSVFRELKVIFPKFQQSPIAGVSTGWCFLLSGMVVTLFSLMTCKKNILNIPSPPTSNYNSLLSLASELVTWPCDILSYGALMQKGFCDT